jgi:hypothetical protein
LKNISPAQVVLPILTIRPACPAMMILPSQSARRSAMSTLKPRSALLLRPLIVAKCMSFNNGKWRGSDQIEKSFSSPDSDCDGSQGSSYLNCLTCNANPFLPACSRLCSQGPRYSFCSKICDVYPQTPFCPTPPSTSD